MTGKLAKRRYLMQEVCRFKLVNPAYRAIRVACLHDETIRPLHLLHSSRIGYREVRTQDTGLAKARGDYDGDQWPQVSPGHCRTHG